MTEVDDDPVAGLTRAVDRLSEDAQNIRSEMRSRTRALWAAVGVGGVVIASFVAAAVVVSYGNRQAIKDNNRKFCPIITANVVMPGDPLPSTGPGIIRARRAKEAADLIGCTTPNVDLPALPTSAVPTATLIPAPETDATPQPAPTP